MQRWIAVVVVTMMLLGGGGLYAYYVYKQNRPSPVWVPLPIRLGLSNEKRDVLVNDLRMKLSRPEVLEQVSKDVGLTKKWRLASDAEGAREIGQRLFVQVGEADTPQGKVPSINIGVTGKRKERVVSNEITMRLMDDVMKILGIKAPPKPGA